MEIFHSNLKDSEVEEDDSIRKGNELVETKQATKRKFDDSHCSEELGDDLEKKNQPNPNDKLKKAKNVGSFFSHSYLNINHHSASSFAVF